MKAGTLEIELIANMARLQKDMDQMKRSVGSAMHDVEMSSKAAEEAMTALNATGARLASGFGLVKAAAAALGLTALGGEAIGVNREFQRLDASLKVATGSADAAAAQMAVLRNFAEKTPYGLEQSVQAFLRLKNLGLDPSTAALTSYGNTAASMSKTLMDMIEAVADAATGEFERLKEFGIRASKEGSKVSFTFQGVTTTVQNSSAAIQKYLMDIGNVQFAGTMDEQMKTLEGGFANLEDAVQAAMVAFGQGGFNDALAEVLAGLTATADGSQTAAAELGEMVGNLIRMGAELAAILGEPLNFVLENLELLEDLVVMAAAGFVTFHAALAIGSVYRYIASLVALERALGATTAGTAMLSAAQKSLQGASAAVFTPMNALIGVAGLVAVGLMSVADANAASEKRLLANAKAADELGISLSQSSRQALAAAEGQTGVGIAAGQAEPEIWSFKNSVDGLTQSLWEQARAARAAKVELLQKKVAEAEQRQNEAFDSTWAGSRNLSRESWEALGQWDISRGVGLGWSSVKSDLANLFSGGRTGRDGLRDMKDAARIAGRLREDLDKALNTPLGNGDLSGGGIVKALGETGKKAKQAKSDVDELVKSMLNARAVAQGNVWDLAQEAQKRQQDDWNDADFAKNNGPVLGNFDIKTMRDAADLAQAAADNWNDYLDNFSRGLDVVSDRVDAAAASMRDAFGSVGGAIGDIITVLDEYGKRQAEIDEQRKIGGLSERELAELRKREASNQLSGMVALTSAAKGLFKEHSKGYQAMAAAEKVLSAIQLARTAVDVAGGAARMFATLGPFAFPAVAAMLGVMASLGFRSGGKSGPSFDLKSYQDAMGTGSVLGDSTAKSDSIARSLDLLTANSDRELEYSNAMVRSLRSIETNIGSLSSLLARQLGVSGGSFDTSGLGLGSSTKIESDLGFGFIVKNALSLASKIPAIGGLLGGIGKALFGTKTTKTLLDQGIMFDPATVADILAGGIDGQTYQDIQTKKKKKTFGITTSNKTRVDTVTGALDDGTEQQVALLIGSMRSGIMAAAGALGIEGAQAAIDAFRVDLGKISLKDLKGSEIQEQLSAIFSKLGDDMAAAAIPGLSAFQKVGEGQFETLMRLAKDYQTIDVQMQSIGRTFGAVGASSVEAREALIDLFGSLDEFVDQTQYYRDNFLTEAEQVAPVMTAVAAELERLGLSGVDSIDSFKSVVNGLDLTTEAGRELYAALMALAPGFNAVEKYQAALADKRQSMEITLLELMGRKTEALALRRRAELAAMDESLRPLQRAIYAYQDLAAKQQEAAQKVSDAQSALSAAYSRESANIQSTADRFRDFAKAIGEFRASLFTDVPGVDSYGIARARFEKTASLARLGNEASLSAFTGDAQSYLDTARNQAGSALDYARDVARVARAADQAQAGANGVASMADRQLAQLTASVKGLIDLNDNVTSVSQAIIDLKKAQEEADEAQAELDKLTNPVPQLQEVNVNLTDIGDVIERLNDTQADTTEQIAALRAEMQPALISIASNTGESARIARRHDRGDTQAVTVETA
ncbi:hypothetical protein FHS51_001424 [Sphingobium wenxiniae]|uniref:Tape measure domain-containing protein n=1 Tax=Sphingobium wenxiniae (strain DSM 21828 / CGMCC 1.7748 / JZ-1) TaxID=595605 RepID=A0A562KKQ2_SPHWJ|nr:tape measure protein [Sphingobium wenxiniae]MBB6191202.1 hypothetical protein [Sphingobium wenxiniae]TWH95999.1 hypothetical protein IQ35_01088 [Sphingobium wenxiniae]